MIGFKAGVSLLDVIGAVHRHRGRYSSATAGILYEHRGSLSRRGGSYPLEGPALTITAEGLALGMRSTAIPRPILGGGIIVSYYVSGLYGVAMAAVGMLVRHRDRLRRYLWPDFG
ncbi:MAG: sodium/proton-translocating pyrophosphatase [Eubacteriales bacterium]